MGWTEGHGRAPPGRRSCSQPLPPSPSCPPTSPGVASNTGAGPCSAPCRGGGHAQAVDGNSSPSGALGTKPRAWGREDAGASGAGQWDASRLQGGGLGTGCSGEDVRPRSPSGNYYFPRGRSSSSGCSRDPSVHSLTVNRGPATLSPLPPPGQSGNQEAQEVAVTALLPLPGPPCTSACG